MSNRSRIMKFCKDRGLKVVSLVWERNRGAAYGDSWDSSCWNLTLLIDGKEVLYAPEDDTTKMAIERMFEEIEDDIVDNMLAADQTDPNAAADAYLESVKLEHSAEYWSEVNDRLAKDQKAREELNKTFVPSAEHMAQIFDV